MNVTALLPMKGHSERVPGKNLRHLGDRPLYRWIMDSLLAAERVDAVVVDTDSDRIAEDVKTYRTDVQVFRRPESLLGDFVSMHQIVHHHAVRLGEGVVLQTHATNPFLGSERIDEAIAQFDEDSDHDSLMSVTPRYARFYDSEGRPINHDPEHLIRTQDLRPLLEENSCLYIASAAVIKRTKRRVGDNPLLFPLDPIESLDIDEERDFQLAEFVAGRIAG